MSQPALPIGQTGEASRQVGRDALASSIALESGESFPPVFATAGMVALMELAAARAMRPVLGPGELSVGVRLSITHTAPTPEGVRVRAVARFTGMEGKLFAFDLVAEDEAGEIGRGTHHRAVVTTTRIVAGAARRRSGGAS
jgi:predicted thioesterase